MDKRYVTIWFLHLTTDWMVKHQPGLQGQPFVLADSIKNRMVVQEASAVAHSKGIEAGMLVADAKAFLPLIQVIDAKQGLAEKLLKRLCEWCIRFTPVASIQPPDGLILDATGCAHLWDGETNYLNDILRRFKNLGYTVRAAMADTIGAAWAVTRFAQHATVVDQGKHTEALMPLPPAALRIDNDVAERLSKLGLTSIGSFIHMTQTALRRRFGQAFIIRLQQALGNAEEFIDPLVPVEPYHERLPCLEPIVTATGIEIALKRLLEALCLRLQKEGKGVRMVVFKGYRVDHKTESIAIGTHHASNNPTHLYKLFEFKISSIEPALGIELFVLEATRVQDVIPLQEAMWTVNGTLEDSKIAELLDRVQGKLTDATITRYLPAEHHLPERSIKPALSLSEQSDTAWQTDKPRPIQLLPEPILIKVTAPVPDYPPMMFTHNGKLHRVAKADGPERIEHEWWLQQGLSRDYYAVEDEEGSRYWIYRSGSYDGKQQPAWFIHGFFA